MIPNGYVLLRHSQPPARVRHVHVHHVHHDPPHRDMHSRLWYRDGARAFPRQEHTLGRRYSCSDLEGLWIRAGGARRFRVLAAAEAEAESRGFQHAYNINASPYSVDRGPWQINSLYHPYWSSYRPARNARGAVVISRNGRDWLPWVTYDHGDEKGKCGYR